MKLYCDRCGGFFGYLDVGFLQPDQDISFRCVACGEEKRNKKELEI
jgi:hypothetical protein